MACARERERERGRRGKEEKRVWEGRKKVSSKRWKSLFVGGRRSAHLAGKWNVARGAILPSTIFPTNSLEYAATTRLVFKWYSAVPPTTLPSLSRSGRRRKREKQTYKTLDEFLIVVVQFLIAFVSSRYIEKRLASESLPYFSTRIEFHWSIDTECEDRSSVITISQQRFN